MRVLNSTFGKVLIVCLFSAPIPVLAQMEKAKPPSPAPIATKVEAPPLEAPPMGAPPSASTMPGDIKPDMPKAPDPLPPEPEGASPPPSMDRAAPMISADTARLPQCSKTITDQCIETGKKKKTSGKYKRK